MQTLISKLQNEISELNKKIDKYSDGKDVYTGHKYGLDQALSVAESLLEMEKEQMIEFASNCIHRNSCFFNIEEYYETFKQQEQ